MNGILHPIPPAQRGMKIPSRPSIFEIFAFSSMSSTGLPALSYIIKKLLISHPNSHILKQLSSHIHWVFFGIRLVVENHWIYTHGASFAESFYHLTRISPNGSPHLIQYRKSRLKRLTFLFFSVILPFTKSRLDAIYTNLTEQNPNIPTTQYQTHTQYTQHNHDQKSYPLSHKLKLFLFTIHSHFTKIFEKIDTKIQLLTNQPLVHWFKLIYPYFHLFSSTISLLCYILYSYKIIDYPMFSHKLQGITLSRINSSLFQKIRSIQSKFALQNTILNLTLLSSWNPGLPLPRIISQLLHSREWTSQHLQEHWILNYPQLAGIYGWFRSWYTDLFGLSTPSGSSGSMGVRILFPMFLFAFKLLEWWNATPSTPSADLPTPNLNLTNAPIIETQGQRSELLGVDSIDILDNRNTNANTNGNGHSVPIINLPTHTNANTDTGTGTLISLPSTSTSPTTTFDMLQIRKRLLYLNSMIYNLKYDTEIQPPKSSITPVTECTAVLEKSSSSSTTPNICPLCSKPYTLPTVIVSSGYVFCYACIYQHLKTIGQCPLSGMPASMIHLRSLFDN